jgi:hypothetical protein
VQFKRPGRKLSVETWIFIRPMQRLRHKSEIKTQLPDRRYNWLVRMLLRHYASNLRRSWRNTPHSAFVDALVQIEVPLVLAITAPLALLNLALSRTFFPALTRMPHSSISNGGLIVCAVGLAVLWAIDRTLKKYEFIPRVESAFDTPQDRKLVYVYYAGGFIVIVAMLFAAWFINSIFPAIPP